MNRRFVLITIAPILLIAATIGIRIAALGGTPVVELKTAEPLTGAISQSLGTSGSDGAAIPTVGKDYDLKDVKYLDNQTWVVAKVSPTGEDIETATIVMKKVAETYQIILGPGTSFSGDDMNGLPGDVVQYIKETGVVIYE